MENGSKRYDMINILRLVCGYLVVAIHLGAFGSAGNLVKIVTSDFICRIAVPFFFITSGYFFYFNVHKGGYLKKYVKKFITIYIFITIIHLITFISTSMYLGDIKNGGIYTIKAFFVNGVIPSLWYFPALIISITIVNLFLKRDLIKSLVLVSIILFIIGLMGDTYFGLIKNTSLINIVNGYNIIFDNTRNGIAFGIPFITIGVLINKYKLNEKIKKTSRLFILFSIIYALECYLLIHNNIPKDCNIYFSLVLVVPIIFVMALNSKTTISKETSRYIREMSLWIYAFHELVYMLFCTYVFFTATNSFFAYVFVCGVVTLIAYIITKIRLKGTVLNKTASRKIMLYYGLMVIISWILIKAPIDNSATIAQSAAPKVDFCSIENNESTNVTGPMWKISDEDSSIYLYSCFTLIADQIAGDKNIYPLSSTFDNALNDSDEIILYANKYDRGDDDTDNLYFSLKNDSLDNHITKEAYDILMDRAKEVTEKVKEDRINFYSYLTECKGGKTYYDVNNYLSPEELDFENGKYSTDEYLKYKARKYTKKVDYMLNSSKLWIAVCNNDDNEVNNAYAMLTKYINKDYANNMKKAFDYWKQGDNDKAVQTFNTFTFENEEDKKNFEKYNKIVQEYYNKVFQPFREKNIDNISTYLKDNRKCFVSLDFKILSGENNILKDLQDKGYKVEKIESK